MSAVIPVLTVDGPGGAGKGTVCMRVAVAMGWHLLDSGALYRLLGLAARQNGIELTDESALARQAESLDVSFEINRDATAVTTLLEGRPVDELLRTEQAGSDASQVAAIPTVREALLERQRGFAKPPGLVADGRDMGTVVFPQADLKVFLTASAEERARRRYMQLKEQGLSASLSALRDEMEARDRRDRERSVAPLKPADDAWELDTTDLDIVSVVDMILERLRDVLPEPSPRPAE
ncbi:MAG: (d)CMP kinase [Pseudomonadota bacterium]